MNDLDCRRMLTIAKQIRNTANSEGWTTEDETRQLATLAILAYEEISKLRIENIALRRECEEAAWHLGDALARTVNG